MPTKSLAEQMAAAAADGVKLTDIYFTEKLDFSEASVATIERLVDDVHYAMPNGKTPATIDLLCRVWGAYIGEVLRRHIGGEWVVYEGKFGQDIAIQSGGFRAFPADKVRKRLTEGEEHNLRGYYLALRELMAPSKEPAEPGAAPDPGRT